MQIFKSKEEAPEPVVDGMMIIYNKAIDAKVDKTALNALTNGDNAHYRLIVGIPSDFLPTQGDTYARILLQKKSEGADVSEGGARRRRNRKSRKNKAKKSRKARNNADNSDRKSRRGRGYIEEPDAIN